MTTGPMSGVRVVEISAWLTSPWAGAILADQGADVIKIEPPEGDLYRYSGTSFANVSAQWVAVNRNKRSVCLDLKKETHRSVLHRLVAKADVVTQNLRPGAIDRLGFGPDELRARHPRLIYGTVNGYGPVGPHAGEGAWDTMMQAMSGLAYVQADPVTKRPQMVRTIVADKFTGQTFAQAITAALFQRERTGQGCVIDLAMIDAAVWWLWPDGMTNETFLSPDAKKSNPVSDVDLVCPTSDGFLVVTAHIDRDWKRIAEYLGRSDWLTDPRLSTGQARGENLKFYAEQLRGAFTTKTTAEWMAIFKQLDMTASPVLTREQMITYPQVVANEIIGEYEHPQAGRYRAARGAAIFDGVKSSVRMPPPALGAHTIEVLSEHGIDPAELD